VAEAGCNVGCLAIEYGGIYDTSSWPCINVQKAEALWADYQSQWTTQLGNQWAANPGQMVAHAAAMVGGTAVGFLLGGPAGAALGAMAVGSIMGTYDCAQEGQDPHGTWHSCTPRRTYGLGARKFGHAF
jgi:hypothetical protein